MLNKFKLLILMFLPVFYLQAQAIETYSLQQAIDKAKENNYKVLQALKDIEQAKEQVWETKAIGLPQVNGFAKYTNNLKQAVSLLPGEFFGGEPGTFSEVTFGTKQSMSAGIQLNQILFDGSYLVGLKSVEVFQNITKQSKSKIELEVVESVINAYANAILVEENIEILKKNLRIIDKSLYEVSQIYKEGFTELQDVEQLELSQLQLQTTLKSTERQVLLTNNILKFILGVPLKDKIQLSDSIEDLIRFSSDLKSVKNLDVRSHIDYKMVENSVKSSELELKLAKVAALPSLTTDIGYTLNAQSNNFPLTEKWFNISAWNVNLNVPIFSSFKRRAKTQRMQLALEESEIQKIEKEEELKLDFLNKKISYENSFDVYENSIKAKQLAEKIYHKEKIKFKEGLTTSTSLTTVEKQFYETQNQYIQAVLSLINNKSALNKALGIY